MRYTRTPPRRSPNRYEENSIPYLKFLDYCGAVENGLNDRLLHEMRTTDASGCGVVGVVKSIEDSAIDNAMHVVWSIRDEEERLRHFTHHSGMSPNRAWDTLAQTFSENMFEFYLDKVAPSAHYRLVQAFLLMDGDGLIPDNGYRRDYGSAPHWECIDGFTRYIALRCPTVPQVITLLFEKIRDGMHADICDITSTFETSYAQALRDSNRSLHGDGAALADHYLHAYPQAIGSTKLKDLLYWAIASRYNRDGELVEYLESRTANLADHTRALPKDVRMLIARRLRYVDIVALAATSKAWHAVWSKGYDCMWLTLYKRAFLKHIPSFKPSGPVRWHHLFRYQLQYASMGPRCRPVLVDFLKSEAKLALPDTFELRFITAKISDKTLLQQRWDRLRAPNQ